MKKSSMGMDFLGRENTAAKANAALTTNGGGGRGGGGRPSSKKDDVIDSPRRILHKALPQKILSLFRKHIRNLGNLIAATNHHQHIRRRQGALPVSMFSTVHPRAHTSAAAEWSSLDIA